MQAMRGWFRPLQRQLCTPQLLFRRRFPTTLRYLSKQARKRAPRQIPRLTAEDVKRAERLQGFRAGETSTFDFLFRFMRNMFYIAGVSMPVLFIWSTLDSVRARSFFPQYGKRVYLRDPDPSIEPPLEMVPERLLYMRVFGTPLPKGVKYQPAPKKRRKLWTDEEAEKQAELEESLASDEDRLNVPTFVVVGHLGTFATERYAHLAEAVALRLLEEHGQCVRFIVYDRVNSGWSWCPSNRRRLKRMPHMSEELEELIRATHLDQPVVLVSFGMGETLARYFAQKHPERVAASVFVSPMPSLTMIETVGEGKSFDIQFIQDKLWNQHLLSFFGLSRLFRMAPVLDPHSSEVVAKRIQWNAQNPVASYTAYREFLALACAPRDVSGNHLGLPEMNTVLPVLVICHNPELEVKRVMGMKVLKDAGKVLAMERAYEKWAHELAKMTDGTLRTVNTANHAIEGPNVDILADEIVDFFVQKVLTVLKAKPANPTA